jgi:hypothetical protein
MLVAPEDGRLLSIAGASRLQAARLAVLYVALHGALVFLAMLATLAGVLSVARGALDAREVAPQHAVVAETIGV